MKKIILFIAAVLLFSCLYSCTTNDNNDEPVTNPKTESEVKQITKETTQEPATEPITEPATIAIEVWQVPDIPADFVTANIKDISSGIVFEKNFRRGINLGNMLESPNEGEWGVHYNPKFFPAIKQRGFDFIRLPVGWGNHLVVKNNSDIINISKSFNDRVKEIVDEALKNDLGVVINIHHYNDMDENPEKNADRLYQIWRIISEQYQNYPANVVFEIFNEPHDKLDTKTWNQYQNECIKIIRKTNPTRKIVVSAGDWGGIGGMKDLILPDDENLIFSFHCYDPFNFTHQGADWSSGEGGMDQHLGTQWTGSDFEKRNLENSFRAVKAWSETTGLPVLMGEFGAYEKAPMESRVRWTNYMRETAEYYGFAWSYWEFCAGFGIYDQNSGEFFEDLANALTGTPLNESVYATGTGRPAISMIKENGYIGPFKTERNINIICDSWTGMSLYDTENNTQIIELGGANTSDWAHPYIILEGLTDTGDKFSHDICELTIRNIDWSITDFCINLDNSTSLETQLAWMDEKTLKGESVSNTYSVIQNGDGTTTFILDLQKVYKTFAGKNSEVFRLKIFIESVPDRSGNYDREGMIEFIKVELK